MNRRLFALSAACMMMTSVAACGDKKSSASIEDVAAAASKVIKKGYEGIISSDAKHTFTDSKSIGYRQSIRKQAKFDDEWLLIAINGKTQLYYAKDWDSTANGYKKAENKKGLTLEEIYQDALKKFDSGKEPAEPTTGSEGIIQQTNRNSANSAAKSMQKALLAAFTDADALGYDVSDIGYVVFTSGKITDINYFGNDVDDLIKLIENSVAAYYEDSEKLEQVVAFCSRGSVDMLFWSKGAYQDIEGCYPVDEYYYDRSLDQVFEEFYEDYYVEPKPETPVGSLGDIKLNSGGDELVIVMPWDDDYDHIVDIWAEYSGNSRSNVEIKPIGVSGSEAPDYYDRMFAAGEDIDIYLVEADWGQNYMCDSSRAAPLSDLGFSDSDFINSYGYALEIGRAAAGENKGKLTAAAIQACPGGFAYRADLAAQYLGVNTPDEMQQKISDWDKFAEAAQEIYSASGGKVNLADSVGGMFQAFACNKSTPWYANGGLSFDDSCAHFTEVAKNLWNNGGVSHSGQWYDSWITEGIEGSTMGYFITTWALGENTFFDNVSSESKGSWKVIQGPDPFYWGGSWMVVNPYTDNADLAQSFIYTTCINSEAMYDISVELDKFVNNKQVMEMLTSYSPGAAYDFFDGQNYYEALHKNALAVDLSGKITPYDYTLRYAFIDKLSYDYLEKGASLDQIVDDVSKICQERLP